VILSAGDLGVGIDTGDNGPGPIQRLDDDWSDYLKDGQPGTWPVKLEQLEPGKYRVRDCAGPT
jgi:hypothetical protein